MFKVISSAFSSREREIIVDCIKYFPEVSFGKIGVFKEVGYVCNAMFDALVDEIVLSGIRDDMSEDDFRFQALHEMRHFEQHFQGRLQFRENGDIYWDGEQPFSRLEMYFMTGDQYCSMIPWELDANTFALSVMPDYKPTNELLRFNVEAVLN